MISGFLESTGIYVLIHPKENEPSASGQPIKMTTLRHVSRVGKLIFPLMVLTFSILVLLESIPLIGAFSLSDSMQNTLINQVLSWPKL